MIIFLYGADTFRSRTQLHKMTQKFRTDRDPQGLNVVRLDCEKEQLPTILEQLYASPFLAEKRMVVLENPISSSLASLCDTLRESAEKIPDDTILVLWESGESWKKKEQQALFDRLKKEKYAQHFEVLSGARLSQWIDEEVKARGAVIERAAVDFLAQHVGGDMWHLSSLIDQLSAYAGEKTITTADVALFLDEKVDDNIFNLVDAIVGGQAKHVFEMMREQYDQGKDVLYLFAMILRQFRILLQIRDFFEREDNATSDRIAKEVGLHPFVVKKALPLARRYSMKELQKIYSDLLDLDAKIKTGRGDQSVLLDVFVAKMCAKAN